MKVKVCGLNDVSNITEVLELQPNFMGFIFYDKSARNCTIANNVVRELKLGKTKKVGVFVNEKREKLLQTVNDFGLDYVQLHGGESAVYCKELIASGLKLIKAFSIASMILSSIPSWVISKPSVRAYTETFLPSLNACRIPSRTFFMTSFL